MELQKINVKLFAAESPTVSLAEFIDIFHGWIQASDGVYHDVDDYSHMHAGPGIVLVANDANVSIDETDHRRGLLFNQKRSLAGTNQEILRRVLRAALENCRKLEEEPALRGRVKFAGNEILVWVNDRLNAPNTDQTFAELKSEIESVASALYGDADIRFERDEDSRRRLNIHIKTSDPIELDQLLNRLQNT